VMLSGIRGGGETVTQKIEQRDGCCLVSVGVGEYFN